MATKWCVVANDGTEMIEEYDGNGGWGPVNVETPKGWQGVKYRHRCGAFPTCPTCRIDKAESLGSEHGKASGTWVFDGNTSNDTYLRIRDGIENCDPEVLDGLRSAPLSGEWADEYTTRDLERDLSIDPDDESDDIETYANAYEDAWLDAYHAEIVRVADYHLAATD